MSGLRSRQAPPQAGAMIEALRGLGYNTATAIADIIDNSITARARSVNVDFKWDDSNSRILICDDGRGMSATELDHAMRLGRRNPLDIRDENDLGRFGLGLKTASFSQCRRLTVITTGIDGLHSLRWDLDVLANQADGGWHLLEGPFPEVEDLIEPLKATGHGTLVVWEVLDRIVTENYNVQDFLNLMDYVESHLAMVFHRFLEKGRSQFSILLNGKPVPPWDPFLTNHPAKPWHSPVQSFRNSGIKIECHVLPHKDRLSAKEFESAQGPEGWIAQQGFYIYRNERLLVAGSWLGLRPPDARKPWIKDEPHKLARIRLDITNSTDQEWKIDIRKSTARPPAHLRHWLIGHAESTRVRSRKVFAHRGQVSRASAGTEIMQAWRAEHFTDGMRYRIDTNHPAIKSVIEGAGGLLPEIKTMIRIIEETVPVQRIWLDTAENKDTPHTGFSGEPSAAILEVLEVMYRNMVIKRGMAPQLAKQTLLCSEPFQDYPELIQSLPDQPV